MFLDLPLDIQAVIIQEYASMDSCIKLILSCSYLYTIFDKELNDLSIARKNLPAYNGNDKYEDYKLKQQYIENNNIFIATSYHITITCPDLNLQTLAEVANTNNYMVKYHYKDKRRIKKGKEIIVTRPKLKLDYRNIGSTNSGKYRITIYKNNIPITISEKNYISIRNVVDYGMFHEILQDLTNNIIPKSTESSLKIVSIGIETFSRYFVLIQTQNKILTATIRSMLGQYKRPYYKAGKRCHDVTEGILYEKDDVKITIIYSNRYHCRNVNSTYIINYVSKNTNFTCPIRIDVVYLYDYLHYNYAYHFMTDHIDKIIIVHKHLMNLLNK